jgi:chromosome segregation ATPase
VQQVARLDEMVATTAELGRSVAALQQQKPQVDAAISRVTHLDAAATALADAVERLQREVEDARSSAQRSGAIADEVNSGLETLRTSAAQLAHDYAALRDASSEAQAQAAAAAAAAAEAAGSLREKVAAIDRLHELGRSTDEKVRQLVTLADQADRRTSFLLDQQPLVERALQQFPLVQDLAGTTAELARSVAALQQQQPHIDEAVQRVARLGDVAERIEGLRLQAEAVGDGLADSKAVAADVSAAVGTVRAMAAQLAQEYAGLRDVSRQARDEAAAATAAATEAAASVREKLAAMEMLNHLGRATDEKLRGLKTIAEQVDQKAGELQVQQPLVDRALAQAAQVRELSEAADALTRSVAALREQQPRVEEALSRAAQVEAMALTLQRLTEQIDAAHAGIADTTGLAADVQTEVNGIRIAATQLATDFGGLRESARHSAEQARAAAEGVLAVRQKLGEVEAIAALRRTVDEQFAQLTALADDGSRMLAALHAFQPSHDVAVEHARQLAGLNVEAAARIETINAGLARAARLDSLLQRLEALEAETDARVQSVSVVRDACARAVQSAEDDTRSLIRSLDADVQRISGQVAGLKSDVDVVDRQRAALDALRHDVEQLTGRTRQAEQHAASLMAQRAAIVDMETNLTFLTRLLNSVRADLKSIVERKDVIDGFAQKVSSVELALQHAQHVLGTLQSERQLAERIEQSLRQLRMRA